ncbi:hypothetical protein DV736_g4738, partial [Chaetothyriales sp. CBS 134916]
MAFSPPNSLLPTLSNRTKRPSVGSHASQAGPSKKPKLHPLRNFSSPTTQDVSAISTSAISDTGSVANSMVSRTSSKVPGGVRRGRPKRSTQVNNDETRDAAHRQSDARSQAGRSKVDARSVISTKSGAVVADEEEEGEAFDEDIGEDEQTRMMEEATAAKEREIRLTKTLDPDASARYAAYLTAKLDGTTIKRMANATCSQSLTKNPLWAIAFYTKYFTAEIIERAREVQIEYAKVYETTRETQAKWRVDELERLEKEAEGGLGVQEKMLAQRDIARLKKEVKEYLPNPHRGGLLPDHLREALRRYKADGEGGGVGMEGLSHPLLGLQGAKVWRVGDGAAPRRLFR